MAFRIGSGRALGRGFTLIELLILVAVLGIAGGMLVPYLSNVTDFETEAAARQIAADLTFAQSDAVAHQTSRRVWFETDGSGYRILASPFDYDADVIYSPTQGNGSGLFIVNFQTQVRFRNTMIIEPTFDGSNNFVTYDELGGPIADDGSPGAGGSLKVSGDGGQFQIAIAPFTGRVTVSAVEE